MNLARTLCRAVGRVTIPIIFRELPPDPAAMVPTREPKCFFMVKIHAEDLDGWLNHLWSRPGGRLVHLIRAPEEMVASGYLYHFRGSESIWTNSTTCSRDLCVPDDADGAGYPRIEISTDEKRESDSVRSIAAQKRCSLPRLFTPMALLPWLRAYGCPEDAVTYLECLRRVDQPQGLRIEARRAAATLSDMLDISARTAGDRTLEIPLEQLKPGRFNKTVAALAEWIGAANTATEVEHIVANATVACLADHHVTKQATVSTEIKTKVESLDGLTHELAVRSSLSRATRPPLLAAGSMQQWQPGTTGIVTCTAPALLAATLKMIGRLRDLNCTLPIEVWHVRELEPGDEARLGALSGGALSVHDMYGSLPGASGDPDSPDFRLVRGFMCKPLALLRSHFDNVVLVDHDALFASDPASLLSSETFVSTGMLFFRDRHQMNVPGAPVKSPSRYVRRLIRRRMGVPSMFTRVPAAGAASGDGHDLPSLPWPWRPSEDMLNSAMARGESNHFMDSSVLLLSKKAAPLVVAALYHLHDLYRFEVYANVHGDKETFWLACELVGGLRCGVSPLAAGEMGNFDREGRTARFNATHTDAAGTPCLSGNLVQFNPTTGVPIHCNCKADKLESYTAVSKPIRAEPALLPWLASGSTILQLVDSTERPGGPAELHFAAALQDSGSAAEVEPTAGQCWTEQQSRPIAAFFSAAGE